MVLQGGAVRVDLHGGKLIDSLLAVEVQLKGGQLHAGDDVPDKMTQVVADKLALLEVEQRSSDGSFVLDTTRGGVLNALYMEALPYAAAQQTEGQQQGK